jgi:phenylacetyl-CoA:acceptor oxidoreductase 26-kDa subunit
MSFGPDPWHQGSWDARAACNFMFGGAGSGLVIVAALAGAGPALMAVGLILIAAGLFAVWLELGRPWRSWRVIRHGARSWMSREALVAPLVFAAVAAAWLGVAGAAWGAALLALAFVYCQARLLQAAKGIPAWREPLGVPLLMATALAEGAAALLLLGAAPALVWIVFALALAARTTLWQLWRRRVRSAPRALAAIDAAGRWFIGASVLALALALLLLAWPLGEGATRVIQLVAGALALGSGLWFKFTLVTRAGYNQGFALPHLPVRGVPRRQEAR